MIALTIFFQKNSILGMQNNTLERTTNTCQSIFDEQEKIEIKKVLPMNLQDIRNCADIVSTEKNNRYIFPFLTEQQILNYILPVPQSRNSTLWKTTTNETIVATAVSSEENKNTHVEILAVKVDKHQQGFGSKLLRHIMEYAKERAQTITITVDTKNEPAKNLYTKLGFKIEKNYGDELQLYKYTYPKEI